MTQNAVVADTTTAATTTSFVWNVHEHSWKIRYEQLFDFHQTFGHCRVPNNDVQYPGLGIWVRNQRREYRKLVPVLQQQQQQQQPISFESEHPNLEQPLAAKIVTTTKSSSSNSSSTLTPERLQLLQQLNFEWYKSHNTAWEQQYQRLVSFYQMYHHTNVPQNYDDDNNYATTNSSNKEPSLGKWCMNQRTAYKNQKRLLNSSSNNNSTNSNVNVSLSSTVPTTTTTTSPIGSSNALTPERIQSLEAIPGSMHCYYL